MVQTRRRRAAAVLMAATTVVGITVVVGAPPAGASLGESAMYFREVGNHDYGDLLVFYVRMTDESTSCEVSPDCDPPTGNITYAVSSANGSVSYVDPLVQDLPWSSESTFDAQPPYFPPATYQVQASYQGDFDSPPAQQQSFTIRQRRCETTLVQSVQESAPGGAVEFFADVSSSTAPAGGSVTFFQADGTPAADLVLAVDSPDGDTNMARSGPIQILPTGTTTVYAVYSGDSNHVECRSNDVAHTVKPEPSPTANPDTVVTERGTAVLFQVTSNDSDPTGEDFDENNAELLEGTGPDHGELDRVDGGVETGDFLRYTPEPGYVGDDSFQYFLQMDDGRQSAPATVAIEVTCDPIAVQDDYETPFATPLVVDGDAEPSVLDNDDRCERSVSLLDPPTNGVVTGFSPSNGTFTYTPDAGTSGPDSFTYAYYAGIEVLEVGTVTILVDAETGATTTTTATTSPTSSTSSSSSTSSTSSTSTSTSTSTTVTPTSSTTTSTTAAPTSTTSTTTTSPTGGGQPTSGPTAVLGVTTCAPAPFGDVDGNVHRPAIDCAYESRLTRGTTATTYSPGDPVTRGQTAAFLVRLAALAGYDLPADPPDAFGDDDGTDHEHEIDQLALLGVTLGMDDGFGPELPVSRAQMASFLVRLFERLTGEDLSVGADHFADDDGNLHEAAINMLFDMGVLIGTTEGRAEPSAFVRRDQMATFLMRLVALVTAT